MVSAKALGDLVPLYPKSLPLTKAPGMLVVTVLPLSRRIHASVQPPVPVLSS